MPCKTRHGQVNEVILYLAIQVMKKVAISSRKHTFYESTSGSISQSYTFSDHVSQVKKPFQHLKDAYGDLRSPANPFPGAVQPRRAAAPLSSPFPEGRDAPPDPAAPATVGFRFPHAPASPAASPGPAPHRPAKPQLPPSARGTPLARPGRECPALPGRRGTQERGRAELSRRQRSNGSSRPHPHLPPPLPPRTARGGRPGGGQPAAPTPGPGQALPAAPLPRTYRRHSPAPRPDCERSRRLPAPGSGQGRRREGGGKKKSVEAQKCPTRSGVTLPPPQRAVRAVGELRRSCREALLSDPQLLCHSPAPASPHSTFRTCIKLQFKPIPEPGFRFHRTKGALTPNGNKPNGELCSHSNLLNRLQVQVLRGGREERRGRTRNLQHPPSLRGAPARAARHALLPHAPEAAEGGGGRGRAPSGEPFTSPSPSSGPRPLSPRPTTAPRAAHSLCQGSVGGEEGTAYPPPPPRPSAVAGRALRAGR
ncbi:PREDICTED: basic proline-rich protein-like [Calidris pugnax]|uniref:basic proline-rich protein-like n=1 Tax=Calidris pugnax TaxID=198806 RepID=UPI00071DA36F|nr:PREDICTED: basic proline-rich protein-like [Calidris pugnax]